MKLMLLSSSRTDGTGFLEHARNALADFLAEAPPGPVAFAPFAGIAIGYAEYARRVATVVEPMGREVVGLDSAPDVLDEAGVIMVGGGNTFHLLYEMRARHLLERVRARVKAGTAYVGWSAGSNLAGPSIRTTNDMPIVDPGGFEALDLIPFQLNPHYIEGNPPGHQGETRAERLNEFLLANPGRPVLGLPEGDRVEGRDGSLTLAGERAAWWFRAAGETPWRVEPGSGLPPAGPSG